MIGYIKPYKPELKYREMAIYKAYYCSICKRLKDIGGRIYCWGLSHDLTTMAILHTAMREENEILVKSTCPLNPFRKIYVLNNYLPWISQAAELNVMLGYYKVLDDWRDHPTIRSFIIQIMMRKGY